MAVAALSPNGIVQTYDWIWLVFGLRAHTELLVDDQSIIGLVKQNSLIVRPYTTFGYAYMTSSHFECRPFNLSAVIVAMNKK